MDPSPGFIAHPGVVVGVHKDCVKVKIESVSACASCHAQGVCTTADSAQKIVDVKPDGRLFHVGDVVTVVLQEQQGLLAVLLAYVFPVLLVLMALTTSMSLTRNELLSGCFAIVGLMVYYVVLFSQRHRIKKQFLFFIEL
jgi:sigma-E factor negative regulatory protein RseC